MSPRDPSHPGAAPPGAASVRAALARATFGIVPAGPPGDDVRVGALTLRPYQHAALLRLRALLATHHGALFADDVGLGKTAVALALLRDARAPLVVAPAALRRMWRDAAAAAAVPAPFCSVEALSAPRPPRVAHAAPDLVVVDEAHHCRTPGTRRHARLAALCAGARVLLVTATPVHNRPADLVALLSLFLGERAASLDAATLAHLVVRRRQRDVRHTGARGATASGLPRVATARWRRVPLAATVRHALLALPPPARPAGGGAAPALAAITLVRLAASSDAALRAALRRRLVRAAAMAYALAAGHHPGRRALAAWAADADALQLPLFFDAAADASPHGSPRPSLADLARQVDAHAAGLRAALAALDAAPPVDPARVAWLRAVRAQHAGARVVAFTQFADTARAYYRALAPDGHVALLTAGGGRIASGPVARDALLVRFAPRAAGLAEPARAERVTLLVATDCLSEGLDLRDAAAVVHLDVPWTPARLAQRVGRAARLGTPHATVCVYGLRPDAPVDRWLRLARRLRAKARHARAALGDPLDGAPGGGSPDDASRDLGRRARVVRRLDRWLAACPEPGPHARVVAVRCGHAGFVAACALSTAPGAPHELVASLGGAPTRATRTVARALRLVERAGAVDAPPPAAVRDARAALRRWARHAAAVHALGPPPTTAPLAAGGGTGLPRAPHLRAALERAAAAVRDAPPHRRTARAAAAAALHDALARPASAGTERALAALADHADADAWLAAATSVLAAGRPTPGDSMDDATTSLRVPLRVRLLVLLLP